MNTSTQISIHCPICGLDFVAGASSPSEDVPCTRCGHQIWFRIEQGAAYVILGLLPSDSLESADLTHVGESLLGTGACPHIIVNFSLLQLISIRFFDGLLALQERVRAAGGRLILCGLNPVIREMLQVTKLESQFLLDVIPHAGAPGWTAACDNPLDPLPPGASTPAHYASSPTCGDQAEPPARIVFRLPRYRDRS